MSRRANRPKSRRSRAEKRNETRRLANQQAGKGSAAASGSPVQDGQVGRG